MTSDQKIKRALAQLDTAVQEWYAEHNPKNTEHYASVAFINDVEGNHHISRITLNKDAEGKVFIDIASSRQGAIHGNNTI